MTIDMTDFHEKHAWDPLSTHITSGLLHILEITPIENQFIEWVKTGSSCIPPIKPSKIKDVVPLVMKNSCYIDNF